MRYKNIILKISQRSSNRNLTKFLLELRIIKDLGVAYQYQSKFRGLKGINPWEVEIYSLIVLTGADGGRRSLRFSAPESGREEGGWGESRVSVRSEDAGEEH